MTGGPTTSYLSSHPSPGLTDKKLARKDHKQLERLSAATQELANRRSSMRFSVLRP